VGGMGTLAGAARDDDGFPSLPTPGVDAAAAACPVMPALLPTIGDGAIAILSTLVVQEKRRREEKRSKACSAGSASSGTGAQGDKSCT
jgi:hypothetical protein